MHLAVPLSLGVLELLKSLLLPTLDGSSSDLLIVLDILSIGSLLRNKLKNWLLGNLLWGNWVCLEPTTTVLNSIFCWGTRFTFIIGTAYLRLGSPRYGGRLDALRLQVPVLRHPVLLLGVVQPPLEILLVLLLGGVLEEGHELGQFLSKCSLLELILEEHNLLLEVVPLLNYVVELQLVLLLDLLARGLVLVGRLCRGSALVLANSLLVLGVDVLLQVVPELLFSRYSVPLDLVSSLFLVLRTNNLVPRFTIALATDLCLWN